MAPMAVASSVTLRRRGEHVLVPWPRRRVRRLGRGGRVLDQVGGAHLGPPTLTLTRANYDVEVVFEYAHADDQTAREVAIVEDYVVVVAALSDQRNLERAASKIEALGHGDRDRIFTFVTEDVDGGGRRLRIRFPLQVVSSP